MLSRRDLQFTSVDSQPDLRGKCVAGVDIGGSAETGVLGEGVSSVSCSDCSAELDDVADIVGEAATVHPHSSEAHITQNSRILPVLRFMGKPLL